MGKEITRTLPDYESEVITKRFLCNYVNYWHTSILALKRNSLTVRSKPYFSIKSSA